jgi:hypothetical protein
MKDDLMEANLWLDFVLGSCIILLPLAVLIITIALDLDRKEKQLMQSNHGTSGRAKDAEEHENDAHILFQRKVRIFKKFSTVAYILIGLMLGILPLLDELGFHWEWK